MIRSVLTTSILVGLGVCILACGRNVGGPSSLDAATTIVAAHLPNGWTVATREDDQLPRGHYWGDWGRDYTGPLGRHMVLVGPQSVAMFWRATDGSSHSDAIARESLDVWIMPANYHEGFWSRINPEAPEHPIDVFVGANVRVFAMPSHTLIDQKHFTRILADATETDWPGSPSRTQKLSWPMWRTTLITALVDGS